MHMASRPNVSKDVRHSSSARTNGIVGPLESSPQARRLECSGTGLKGAGKPLTPTGDAETWLRLPAKRYVGSRR